MKSEDRYDSLIRYFAEQHGRDPRQVKRQVRIESAFDPEACSAANCRGLLQFNAITWGQWWDGDLDLDAPPEDFSQKSARNNPEWSIRAGCAYMAALEKRFGSLSAALAAYNWGPGRIKETQAAHPQAWMNYLPRETSRYVTRCLDFEGEVLA